MKTKAVKLTTEPIFITDQAAYIQAIGGEFFFVFSEQKPSRCSANEAHVDTKIYVDGQIGKLWAWRRVSSRIKLIISVV